MSTGEEAAKDLERAIRALFAPDEFTDFQPRTLLQAQAALVRWGTHLYLIDEAKAKLYRHFEQLRRVYVKRVEDILRADKIADLEDDAEELRVGHRAAIQRGEEEREEIGS